MKTKDKQLKYEEWLSAENMHETSQKWLSELEFIKDECLFFDDLIKSYTLQMLDSKHFVESKKMIDKLSSNQKETDNKIKSIKAHERELKIMVDGIDQLKEEAVYKEQHRKLIINVNEFLKNYRAFKTQLFNLIKKIIKEQKQKRLLQ
ncbi:hypothetical protein RXV94_06015 [Yeosuana sp. MJ-SS3]|uniref:Uncharacterized protein n=1 Tax=Gilvirhabdus luticola TaxID=3079858 RepID=A0ABU3U5M8_9FLAO|nr:hypothetical protein [Yeosuana sp. MJ-SS3]MDU8885708.1 hypothetical protein [Yeosuana sp. MJ-SS3]